MVHFTLFLSQLVLRNYNTASIYDTFKLSAIAQVLQLSSG